MSGTANGAQPPPLLDCEVVADLLPRPQRIRLRLPAGSTVAAAVQAARDAWGEAAMDWQRLHAGVWGEETDIGRPLQAGDRVELYRSLPNDPRAARRARVAAGRRK